MTDFWALVDEARGTTGDRTVGAALTDRLARLPAGEILAFQRCYDRAEQQADRWDLCAAAYVIRGYVSDDAFSDFRGFLVGLGRDTFERAVADADSLADHPQIRAGHPGEAVEFAAAKAYGRVTGDEDDFWDALDADEDEDDSGHGDGDTWSGAFGSTRDMALIPERLPRLSRLFGLPELRPATPADASAIAGIWHTGWRDGHLGHVPPELEAIRTPVSFHERAAARVGDTTVAVRDGAIAGFVMVAGDEVEQVYVDRAHRGSGVAVLLLGAAERQVARHHRAAWLAVVPGNTRARRFYERCGWRDEGPFDHVAGGVVVPAHRYTKALRPAVTPAR